MHNFVYLADGAARNFIVNPISGGRGASPLLGYARCVASSSVNWALSRRAHSRRTELTCTTLTQLHDALLVTRVSVTTLIGCRAAVRALRFSSVQFGCCEHGLSILSS